jgi:hypothetical protein
MGGGLKFSEHSGAPTFSGRRLENIFPNRHVRLAPERAILRERLSITVEGACGRSSSCRCSETTN